VEKLLVNAYVLVDSDEVGNHESVNELSGYCLSSRDQGFRHVEWAYLYHTYRVGAVWFDQDEERFHQVLSWCQQKQNEYKKILENAKPFIASHFLDNSDKKLSEMGLPEESMVDLIRLYINQYSAWSPISVFFDSEQEESVIPQKASFEKFALVPISINMYDSWTYSDFLEPILKKVDTQFPLKTSGISLPIGMI